MHKPLILFSLINFQILAQQIDSSFAINGIEQINYGPFHSYFSDTEIQDDGKILVLSSNNQVSEPIMISRRLPNGAVDNSFGDGGQVRTTFGFQYSETFEIVQLSNGEILIAGMADGKSAILKLNENGSIDSTFGNNGRVVYQFGPSVGSKIRSLEIDTNGKIVAVGEAYNYDNSSYDLAIVRFNPNGSVDSSFGINGNIKIDMQGFNDLGSCSAIFTDGKILVAGTSINNSGSNNFAMIRLNPEGTLDLSFGNNGKVILAVNSGTVETIENVHILDDQSIIAVGCSAGNFAVLKFDTSGMSAQSFGNQGYTFIDFDDYQDNGFEILIDNENRILIGGYGSSASLGGLFHAAMVRLTPDGQLDVGFGTNGKWINTLEQNQSEIYAMHWLTDGKILIAGASIPSNSSNIQPFLARITIDNLTGLKINDKLSHIVYPNPAKETICLSNVNGNESFAIYNIAGKCLMTGVIEDSKINVNILPNGTYYLNRKSGTNFIQQKFIIFR